MSDSSFIMLYVYGTLSGSMSGYHSLAHLVDDALVNKVTPREMTAVKLDPSFNPDAGIMTSTDTSASIIGEGLGKILYTVKDTVGLCGDGPLRKFGSCIYRNTIEASFNENLIDWDTSK